MKTLLRYILIGIILLSGLPHRAQAADWQAKVDPWVLETSAQGDTEFLIFLVEQADVSGAALLPTKLEKTRYVLERLDEVAQRTQPGVIAALEKLGADYRAYRVANMIWARGSRQVVQAVAGRPDVAHLYANPKVKLDTPATQAFSLERVQVQAPAAPQGIEWNITKVKAPQVWAEGYTGQGAVIAGQDTGYDWDHPALKNQYRGWDGSTADHDYNWHDAIHDETDPNCPQDSPVPCDGYGHGTHTMGTMVGDDGGANQIGMAPGARWIGCRNMDSSGAGTPASYAECFEWFLAPYPYGGIPEDGDPTKAPDVISNSWTCTFGEGCTSNDELLDIVNNVRAAGIVVVAAASNDGPSCSSIGDPPAMYDAAFTVGATNSADTIADFSSRGPVTVDGSNRPKPDISAPGVNVRSCFPGTGYGSSNGTSMATPHVAGLVGLLISAQPALRGQVDEIETLIEQSAVERIDPTCGGDPSGVPNNTYGWGRIDSLAAYQSLNRLSLSKTAPAVVLQGQPLAYALTITHTQGITPTTNVVLTDTLPAGAAFLGATQPYSLMGDVVEWDFPSLGVDESVQVTLTVGMPLTFTGTVTNAVYGVRSEDVYTVYGSPVVTAVYSPTPTLTKTAPAWVPPGGPLTYHLVVDNPHPFDPLHNLVLTDTLPANTSFVAATQPYTLSNQVITWQLPVLAASENWGITLTVQSPLTFTGTITNAAYGATSDEYGPLAGPPVRTEILGLALEKTASAAAVMPGGLLTYTLTVTNLHPSAPTFLLVLTDTLPAGTQFITATNGYTLSGDQVSWSLATLAAGDTWQVQVTVQVNWDAAGAIQNLDYAVRSTEVSVPIAGTPVSTLVWRRLWLPLISTGAP
jgi:uncharacterized repeat protein (TIGR01451 family)